MVNRVALLILIRLPLAGVVHNRWGTILVYVIEVRFSGTSEMLQGAVGATASSAPTLILY